MSTEKQHLRERASMLMASLDDTAVINRGPMSRRELQNAMFELAAVLYHVTREIENPTDEFGRIRICCEGSSDVR